ncbi:formate dehydrogenase subunit gamma [Halomonas halocynthiae]|uniref:formate dehydrogenase subunit gamma n=1 Tax=Halomonas halocynthiae TaxID=176290 RepID=UPI000409261F|nr:formate dehydrogenase subunit gamma [Halomonas halocynthiae]
MSASIEWSSAQVQDSIDALKHKPGALLPILHAIQQHIGYIPDGSVPIIAKSLNLSRAEIHGVISFYHHFRTTPPGHHVIQVCRAEACQAMGGRQLEAHIKDRLGINHHATTADGGISLEAVYCLGNCACAPNISVNERVHGRMNNTHFDALFEEISDALHTQTLEVK